jgi:glycosyltransferase involved in cell wall biosynthesis
MDVFALPSHSEAFSNALLEAMASGCACVGSDVGGTPELIVDGETGLLCQRGSVEDLAAKLRRLIGDAALRKQLGARAAQVTREKFGLARNLTCFSEIYSSMISP